MLKKLVTSSILLCVVTISCNKDNDPTTTTAFTATIEAGVDRAGNDDWFIVREHASGELIDFKNVKPGQSIKFETNKSIQDNKIDVTWFAASEYTIDPLPGKRRSYNALTYMGIDAGKELLLKALSNTGTNNGPDVVGSYKLVITSLPNDFSLGLSDKHGMLDGYEVGAPYPNGYFLRGNAIKIKGDASSQLVSVYPGYGNPKYLFLDNLKDKDNITKDYSDFKEYDKIVSFNLPKAAGIGAMVTAYEGPVAGPTPSLASYVLFNTNQPSLYYGDWGFNIPQASVNLGFLNKFQNYDIELNANGFDYVRKGTPPTSITYIDPSVVTITDKSLTHFAANSSQEYVRRSISYGYENPNETGNTTYMNVSFIGGPDGGVPYQPFPPELLQQFSIDVNKIIFASAEFVLKGESYSDYVNYILFNGAGPSAPYERIAVTVH